MWHFIHPLDIIGRGNRRHAQNRGRVMKKQPSISRNSPALSARSTIARSRMLAGRD
jgi:hypothetical protein